MAKAIKNQKPKQPKTKANKYDTNLKISASFEDAMKVLIKPTKSLKK